MANKKAPSKPKEINVSKDMMDYLRSITAEVISLSEKPEVAEYIEKFNQRANFIQHVRNIVNAPAGEFVFHEGDGKFIEIEK